MIHLVLKSLLAAALLAVINLPLTNSSFATTRNISVQNFTFTPLSINAEVGDTIKFQWVNGTHTTTCNGSSGSILPPGATPWNAGINLNNQEYKVVLDAPGLYSYVSTPSAPSMIGTILATLTGINPTSHNIPEKFALSQNYPNPFNPATTIRFDIAREGIAKLTVYNAVGKEIIELFNENFAAGSYTVNFNAVNLSTGIYFYRLESEGFSEIKKMTLIK